MGLIDLLCPLLIPVKGIAWLGGKVRDMAESDLMDKSKIQENLMELQMQYEMEEIEEEMFKKKEAELLEKLEAIRQYEQKKKQQGK
ncbi:MAG TPA: gas vesicle protein GvpG [Acidobacteriota bacterium]|nr:gas vesicle protein GvpG [Acidobacteriota bacterium]